MSPHATCRTQGSRSSMRPMHLMGRGALDSFSAAGDVYWHWARKWMEMKASSGRMELLWIAMWDIVAMHIWMDACVDHPAALG
jgi:hypothetical protein